MTIKEQLRKLMEQFENNNRDIYIEYVDGDEGDGTSVGHVLESFFTSINIPYVTSFDDMYDSCGFDCWSYAIAWVEDDKPQLEVYRVIAC